MVTPAARTTTTTAAATPTAVIAATTPTATTESSVRQLVRAIGSREDFDQLLEEAGNKIILVEFFAEWCGPCKLISSKLTELAALYADKAIVTKIDVDMLEEIAIEYNVTSIPTFLFLKNKKKIDFVVGSNIDKVMQRMERFCRDPVKKDAKAETVEKVKKVENAAEKTAKGSA